MASNPRRSITAEDTRMAKDLLNQHGNVGAAARASGIPPSTLRRWSSKKHDVESQSYAQVEMPDFPDDGLTATEIIAHKRKAFEKRQKSYDAHTWFPVKVKDDKPIGILWFGDPHVDDDGCNWPLLKDHADLCRATDGLYGANIGDTTNNWSGRLIKLYANQDSSVKTARKLAKWFMLESGVDWIVWLLGNHDQWGDGAAILSMMGAQKIVCHDWEARFRLVFPNKREAHIWASHDFKGHSMWNSMHGPMKAAQMKSESDLYVCGHKHNWGVTTWENAERGFTPTLIRVRGYKYMDEYARNLGIIEQKEGASILTIFDPNANTPSGLISTFVDVDQGAEYLTWLRKQS